MYYNARRLLFPLITPLLLILFSMIVVWQWPQFSGKINNTSELSAFLVIFPLMPFFLFAFTAILGWRSNNTGLILISVILIAAYLAARNVFGGIENYNYSIIPATLILLIPLNILFFAGIKKRNFISKSGIFYFILIVSEVFLVYLICFIIDKPESKFVFDLQKEFPVFSKNILGFTGVFSSFLSYKTVGNISLSVILIFFLCMFLLILYYIRNRDVLAAGYVSILCPLFLGINSSSSHPALMIYFTTAGLILILFTIESSFSLAYIDELTGLPGRRSLSETMANLGKNYSIAMIDIDLFKKFNDTYGHKTGDQVLKMVATKLSEVSGGAKPFRYGGEEFTVIFPGKNAEEAQIYMEEYRQDLESSQFVVRSKERISSSPNNRGISSTKAHKQVKVTVSIGIAEYTKELAKPEKVLKLADKILYKAKRAGRNRVKI